MLISVSPLKNCESGAIPNACRSFGSPFFACFALRSATRFHAFRACLSNPDIVSSVCRFTTRNVVLWHVLAEHDAGTSGRVSEKRTHPPGVNEPLFATLSQRSFVRRVRINKLTASNPPGGKSSDATTSPTCARNSVKRPLRVASQPEQTASQKKEAEQWTWHPLAHPCALSCAKPVPSD